MQPVGAEQHLNDARRLTAWNPDEEKIMRSGIVMLWMLAASLAIAASADYEERRDLKLSADDIKRLEIEAGAGSLEVSGVSGLDDIVVTAIIVVPGRNAERAGSIIESDLTLTLDRAGDDAVLKSYFDYRGRGDSPLVHLEVQMPPELMPQIARPSA